MADPIVEIFRPLPSPDPRRRAPLAIRHVEIERRDRTFIALDPGPEIVAEHAREAEQTLRPVVAD